MFTLVTFRTTLISLILFKELRSSIIKQKQLDFSDKLTTVSFEPTTIEEPYNNYVNIGLYWNDNFLLNWNPFKNPNNSIDFEYIAFLDEYDPVDNIWIAFAFSHDQFMVKLINFFLKLMSNFNKLKFKGG